MPEQFKARVRRIEENVKKRFFNVVPAITVMECEMVLKAYYGGERRMVIALVKKYLWLWWHGFIAGALYWVSDRVGWTKIHYVPATEEYVAHERRHGAKCHASPNCEGGCIDRDQPKWFRAITNWASGTDL